MSGIYLQIRNDSFDQKHPIDFRQILQKKTSRLPDDIIEEVCYRPFHGAAIHHGTLRSGGVYHSPNSGNIVMVAGSCWLHDDDSRLATPEEVLNYIENNGFGDHSTVMGCHAFTYYQPENQLLIIENGHFGIVPVYYRQLALGIAVASEIKSLLEYGDNLPNLDSLAEYLHYGFSITPGTFVDGILKLPANHRLIFEGGKLRIKKLRLFDYTRKEAITAHTYDELSELFERSLARYQADTDTLSSSLSAGLDSRLAALAGQKVGFNIRAICCGEPGSQECRIAGEFARVAGISFARQVINGENFPHWFHNAVWATEGRCAPQHMHYMDSLFTAEYLPEPQLHGVPGEAVIGGYFEKLDLMKSSSETIKKHCRDMIHGNVYWPHETKQSSLSRDLIDCIESKDQRIFQYTLDLVDFSGNYSDFINFGSAGKVLCFAIPGLFSQVLPWTDIVLPFLDPAFYAFCGNLEPTALYDKRAEIIWGIRRYDHCADVPRVKDGVVLPLKQSGKHSYNKEYNRLRRKRQLRYIICRLSRGRINLPQTESFPSYGQWYRKWPKIRRYFSDILLTERSLDRGLWKRKGIETLMRDLRIGRNVWPALSNILLCEIFLRQFVDGLERPENILAHSRLTSIR